MTAILLHQEITPRRPDCVADDAVGCELVSPCYSLFSPVMFGKTGNFPFSWNDLRSIFFQFLTSFPSVMVFSLRCKNCNHLSAKQGYFSVFQGALETITGRQAPTDRGISNCTVPPLLSADPCARPRIKARWALTATMLGVSFGAS